MQEALVLKIIILKHSFFFANTTIVPAVTGSASHFIVRVIGPYPRVESPIKISSFLQMPPDVSIYNLFPRITQLSLN